MLLATLTSGQESIASRQMTATYRLDQYSTQMCFADLLRQVQAIPGQSELSCVVPLRGPSDRHATFQKYLSVDQIELRTNWSHDPEAGLLHGYSYVSLILRAELSHFHIDLEAHGDGVIGQEQIEELREKVLRRLGTPLKIEYLEILK